MSIIASAPVPAPRRLIDADTADLRFPIVNPVYRGLTAVPTDPYERGTGRPELCPDWCPGACGDDAERSHVRPIIDTTARHGDILTERVEIRAQLQAFESPHLPGGIEPAEVWVQLWHDDDGVSVALTPDESERIGLALVEAARTARKARA